MKLHHLRPAPGAHKDRTRVGRGHGSGKGKTAGRGTKGTGARNKVPIWFEGGGMPLQRRLPKIGSFQSRRGVEYTPVNVEALNKFAPGTVVDPDTLHAAGLVRKKKAPVKILGRGTVTVAVTVRAHAFSDSAREKIASAGGSAEVLQPEKRGTSA